MKSSFTPPPIKKAPGKLASIFNALREFVISRDVTAGAGLREDTTKHGRVIKVSNALLQLESAYKQLLSGEPPNDDVTNPWADPGNGGGGWNTTGGGGSGGTGLPDVEEDADGNPTYDDKPLNWTTLNVCVDDGAGGYTPQAIDIYSTAPH
tara:strand:+ start:7272 stop:7724 length:453 start_codon:yes stop_codon:yes gene_type:complete